MYMHVLVYKCEFYIKIRRVCKLAGVDVGKNKIKQGETQKHLNKTQKQAMTALDF